ncbi:MAG: DUF2723 domain-containing protein [Acidobacteria bacterium]|nr:DUF2723 domain-containing protein [Acidobacteriota bacterium]
MSETRLSGRWRDALTLCGLAALAALVYAKTLFPDIGGGGDSVKFQYLGKMLGTAHPPGYPLYVLLGHVFSWLPVGSVAYRANLMSAVFGVVAALAVYLAVREIGATRAAAAAAALGLAFGRAFWAKAVVAEVYTLAGALTALSLWTVLRWATLRTDRWLYASVAFASLAFGNHLSILFVVPSLVAFVLLTDWRRVLRPRVMAAVAAIVLAGAAQYGYVWLRTAQGAVALEATARSFRELVDVVTARRFAADMFHYTAGEVVHDRVPESLASLWRELGWTGAPLAAIGLVWLGRRRPSAFVLLAGALTGVVLLVLNVFGDMEGFLTPAYVAAWIAAGAGAHALAGGVRASRNALSRGGTRGTSLAAAAILVLVAAVQLRANYAANDHHRRDFERRFLTALFDRLPTGAGILQEGYAIDQLVLYKLYAEDDALTRTISMVPRDPERAAAFAGDGHPIVAFDSGAALLADHGFTLQPVALDEPLYMVLRSLPAGTVVAIAARPGAAFGFGPDDAASLATLGIEATFYGAERRGLVAIGVAGAASGALEQLAPENADVAVESGVPIGGTGHPAPLAVRASLSADAAAIAVGGEERARVRDGLALVIIAAGGRAVSAARIDATRAVRVPVDTSDLPVFRATTFGRCVSIGNQGWTDVSRAAATTIVLRVDNYRPFDSTATLYVAGDRDLAPARAGTAGAGTPIVTIDRFSESAADRARLAAALARDGVLPAPALLAAPFAARLAVAVNDDGQSSATSFTLAAPPASAVARAQVDLNNPRRATVCGSTPIGAGSAGSAAPASSP